MRIREPDTSLIPASVSMFAAPTILRVLWVHSHGVKNKHFVRKDITKSFAKLLTQLLCYLLTYTLLYFFTYLLTKLLTYLLVDYPSCLLTYSSGCPIFCELLIFTGESSEAYIFGRISFLFIITVKL